MRFDRAIGLCVGGLGVFINSVWGGMDAMFSALLSLMALDFIAGIICGFKKCELDSRRAYVGITQKKMMTLVMIAVAVVADRIIVSGGAVRSLVIFYYIGMEGLSLFESAARLNFPIPDSLKDKFIQLQEEKDIEFM